MNGLQGKYAYVALFFGCLVLVLGTLLFLAAKTIVIQGEQLEGIRTKSGTMKQEIGRVVEAYAKELEMRYRVRCIFTVDTPRGRQRDVDIDNCFADAAQKAKNDAEAAKK